MNDLLNQALKAHGGLDRWNKMKAIEVAGLPITGAIWYVKGNGDFLKNVVLTAEEEGRAGISRWIFQGRTRGRFSSQAAL